MRRYHAWIWGVAALLVTAPLLANGRFPEAQKLIEDPRDSNRLLLAGTYGMLLSQDRGQNWHYLCEEGFGLEQADGDPLLELLPNGELLGGLISTLNRSADCGCTWIPRLAEPEPEVVRDLTVEKSGDRAAIALIRNIEAGDIFTLHESTDAGQTWTKLADLPSEVEEAFTIDSAPSDASRIYASGLMKSAVTGALIVSSNRGSSWEARSIPGADISNQAYIAAVHPSNPDIVFVRTDGWDDQDYANDALFYTEDAGRTWTELIRRVGKLFGFALSPDGSTVLAGFGDPVEAARFTNYDELGIYKATVGQSSFTKIFDAAISCLSWTSSGLYACHAENHEGFPVDFALGFTANADFTPATPSPFTPLMRLSDVRGPLGCAAAVCNEAWSVGNEEVAAACARFGAECDGPAGSPEPPCGSGSPTGGSGGMGGTAGATGSGGGGAAAGGSATGGSGASDAGPGAGGTAPGSGGQGGAGPAASGGDGGCGCRTGPGSTGGASVLLAMLLGFVSARRKNRRGER